MAVFMTGGKAPSLVNYVGYLESDGNSYIDTGVTPTEGMKLVLKVAPADSGNFYAAIPSASTGRFGLYVVPGGRIDMAFGSSGYVSNALTGVSFPAVITLENGKLTANEAEYTFATQIAFTSAKSLRLFSDGNSIVYGMLYYCQIYVDGKIVRDMWPCYDPDGVACMYDKVEKKYHYNAGTGEFTAG